MLATCHRPRRRGRGVESDKVALERGRLDAVIAGLLFMAGMRRSEVSALRWADVVDSTDGDGMLVTVRRSKTNQEGQVNDVRFVKVCRRRKLTSGTQIFHSVSAAAIRDDAQVGRRRCARRSRPVRRCGGRALITRRTTRLLPRSGAARSPAPSADAGRLCSALFTFNMNDSPTRIDPEEAAIGRPTGTARRLVEASVSPNTRRAYAGALRRLDAWVDGRELHDVTLAAYLAELHDAGRASSSAAMAVAAACFRTKLAGQPAPAGERTARVLAGYRRTASDRGRGQAQPFGASDLAAVLATCHRPRRRGRGVESEEVALERGRLDAVIAGLLFMAGMRRSEVSALRWADVVDSTDGARVLAGYRRTASDSGPRTSAAVRGLGPGGRAGHVPSAAAARSRRRVRGGRSRAWASRCRDRRTAVHGGIRRSEVSALRWSDVVDSTGRRRHARHRAPQQDPTRRAR